MGRTGGGGAVIERATENTTHFYSQRFSSKCLRPISPIYAGHFWVFPCPSPVIARTEDQADRSKSIYIYKYLCQYTCMATVTLYVRDADAKLIEEAKAKLGDSLSSVFMDCVRDRVD